MSLSHFGDLQPKSPLVLQHPAIKPSSGTWAANGALALLRLMQASCGIEIAARNPLDPADTFEALLGLEVVSTLPIARLLQILSAVEFVTSLAITENIPQDQYGREKIVASLRAYAEAAIAIAQLVLEVSGKKFEINKEDAELAAEILEKAIENEELDAAIIQAMEEAANGKEDADADDAIDHLKTLLVASVNQLSFFSELPATQYASPSCGDDSGTGAVTEAAGLCFRIAVLSCAIAVIAALFGSSDDRGLSGAIYHGGMAVAPGDPATDASRKPPESQSRSNREKILKMFAECKKREEAAKNQQPGHRAPRGAAGGEKKQHPVATWRQKPSGGESGKKRPGHMHLPTWHSTKRPFERGAANSFEKAKAKTQKRLDSKASHRVDGDSDVMARILPVD